MWDRLLVLTGLIAAGVVTPLLDLYGKNPEVFVANRSTVAQIVVFATVVTFTLPLLVLAVLGAARFIGPRTSDVAYLIMLLAAAGATGLVVSRQTVPDSTWGALVVALVVASIAVLVSHTAPAVLRVFAVAAPIVLILFLTTSATSRLLWVQPAEAVASTTVANPAPLVMIQLDEFPVASLLDSDATINEALFPNFARLATSGSWYRNAFSNSIATTQSVPAILTGRLGDPEASPSAVDHPNSLFTLLADAYEMHVIEWVTDMCPQDVCEDFAGRAPARFASLLQDVGVVYGHLSLPAGARNRLPSIDNSWKGFVGQADNPEAPPIDVPGLTVPRAGERSAWIDWLQRVTNGISSGSPQTLSFVHLQAPHAPWRVNPSGTHYERPEEYDEVDGVELGGYWVDDTAFPLIGFQRHLYQLGFLDAMLGRLFHRLDETGTWDEAMIVVLADHGASFVAGEHRRWPYADNRDDLYRIPLFVKYPGQLEGELVDTPVFAIDVLPTIVDTLGISTDWVFDGQSLRTIGDTDRPHAPIAWCCNREPVDTDLASLQAQVSRNHGWIPDQSSWVGVAAVGPHRALVGHPVAELDPQPHPQLRWSLENGAALTDVDRSKGYVQTLVYGRIELPEGTTDRNIVIAVNGVVAGTGFIARDGANQGEVRGLIAEELVADGANEIAILVPDPDGGWLTGEAADLEIEFLADDGHVLALRPEGNRRIQISTVTATGAGWRITGWAADIGAKTPPDTVYVFAGEQLVAVTPPNRDEPNVVRWFGSDTLLRSGFTFEVAAGDVPAGLDRLLVIAEFGDVAVSNAVPLDP